jgi:hypothetical protein
VIQQWLLAELGDEARVHISQPVFSPDGRLAALTVAPLGNETAHLAQTLIYETASGKRWRSYRG